MGEATRTAERFWTALRDDTVPGANMRPWDELDHRTRTRLARAMAKATQPTT